MTSDDRNDSSRRAPLDEEADALLSSLTDRPYRDPQATVPGDIDMLEELSDDEDAEDRRKAPVQRRLPRPNPLSATARPLASSKQTRPGGFAPAADTEDEDIDDILQPLEELSPDPARDMVADLDDIEDVSDPDSLGVELTDEGTADDVDALMDGAPAGADMTADLETVGFDELGIEELDSNAAASEMPPAFEPPDDGAEGTERVSELPTAPPPAMENADAEARGLAEVLEPEDEVQSEPMLEDDDFEDEEAEPSERVVVEPRMPVFDSTGDERDERPAAQYLASAGLLDAWRRRAVWLEREAASLSEPATAARALLAASECRAMVGDIEEARRAAVAATELATVPLAGLVARQLAALQEDWKTVTSALDGEIRSAQSPETRAHAAYLAGEIHRLKLGDPAGGQRRLDQAARAWAADPRPVVQRSAEQLAESATPPKVRRPQAPELAPIAEALEHLGRLRGAPAQTPAPSAVVAFDQARRALSRGDRSGAAEALESLEDLPVLTRSVLWLRAALLAPSEQTRAGAVAVLETLLERFPGPDVQRALAARAVEQGDPEAVKRALGEDQPPGAFAAADRIALAALTGGDTTNLGPAFEELMATAATRPLAAAARAALSGELLPVSETPESDDDALGRRLGRAQSMTDLEESIAARQAARPDDALTRALVLELAWSQARHEEVAERIRHVGSASDFANELSSGFVAEVGGLSELATKRYRSALSSEAFGEAALRALAERADPATRADLLSLFVNTLEGGSPEGRALLLYEAAALRLDQDPSAAEALARESVESAPDLPFGHRLNNHFARSAGDAERLVLSLRRRREASPDERERTADLVREALLTADDDRRGAVHALGEALQNRPEDLALRELYERLAHLQPAERAAWREQLAERLEDRRVRGRLYLEATLAQEESGNLTDAARLAELALGADATPRAKAAWARLAPFGGAASARSEELLSQVKSESEPDRARDLYEELSRLDAARGDHSGALMWQRMIFEAQPNYLPALRALEHAYVKDAREEELEPIFASLARMDDAREGPAHAALAARLRSRHAKWEDRGELVDLACRFEPAPLWALRERAAHAALGTHGEDLLHALQQLLPRVSRPLDSATIALRAAEAAVSAGRVDAARDFLDVALDRAPTHLVALAARAEVRERAGDTRGAADDLTHFADLSHVKEHQVEALRRAAMLCLDSLKDPDRATELLERAAAIDITHDGVFRALQERYLQSANRSKLAELLERRLTEVNDPNERLALEVGRGRALAEVGDRSAAREALSAALDANPEHADALEVYASLCAADGEYDEAEQAWIRLARVVHEPARQAEIYRKLAGLYDEALPNPQRAEICYREVLKRQPNDVAAMERLVDVYIRLKEGEKALELQTGLVERAGSMEEKRDRTLGLAKVYELGLDDKKRALATLEKSRKAWPHDSEVLRALAQYYQRAGETAAFNVLLDRAATEARRALAHGRFDAGFFSVLMASAELRGGADAARVAGATLAALDGRASPLSGAGAAAGAPELDDLLAPELLSPALRSLLKKVAGVLDAAFPVDLRALGASPLPAEAGDFVQEVREVAASLGVQQVEVLVSAAVGHSWLPASATPPRIIVGQALLDSPDFAARYYSLFRCLKLVQGQAAALSRIAPIELMPTVAALLSIFAPSYQPHNVDATKFDAAKKRIQANLLPRIDDDVATLALEIGGFVGNRASQLGTAVNQWGNRAALLAVGDPGVALRAIGVGTAATRALPEHGVERLKWIVRNPEARDVAVFSVSEAYADARRRVGL